MTYFDSMVKGKILVIFNSSEKLCGQFCDYALFLQS